MISRFFIDRPIFATVLSLVITLTGGIALYTLPIAQYPRITPPGVSVSISYPGASAQVVADTVAAPIEQSVTGVPGMLYMSSQSGNDGSYSLAVTFDVNTDLDAALVMVQNRVTLAMPLLPTQVQNQGITIRKKTPDILMIINLSSPDGRYDDLYLSNFGLINIRDELLRVDGVSDVNIFGERDYSIRAWLDPQKLASRHMTAIDVANAVRTQNLETAAGQIGQPPARRGQPFQLPLDTLGRLREPEQFRNIIVKVARGMPPQATTGVGAPSPGGSGLPSPFTDPLAWNAPSATTTTTTTGSTTSSAGTSGTGTTAGTTPGSSTTPGGGTTGTGTSGSTGAVTGGASTGGGASAGGGGTTGGGATTPGGGTTAGVALGGAPGGLVIGGAVSPSMGNGVLSATSGGRPQSLSTAVVRMRDVACVELGALNYNMACFFDGKPSVGLAVFQLPGTNALDVADRVRAKMEELKVRFPDGVTYTIGYDTTPFIRESIDEVFKTLRDAVILVAIVVLLFLQDWRAMILPMIDVPVSLIGTFAVMALLGYSLNNISLFGLVLAIGIVVDDAIVVLENIERQMAKGLATREATIKAMEEISGPIIAITLVLSAVFVPCAFISGITGRFFKQFAVTIAASTIISAINALTMTPSRALFIFKMEEGNEGHTHKKEALPWWIFAVLGGVFTASWGPALLGGLPGLPDPAGGEGQANVPGWLSWTISGVYFLPGALLGGVLGWFLIGPVNAGLRWFFRGFNWFFEHVTNGYGWTIGMAMRLSVVVLLLYGGLLALTWGLFRSAPTGFVPQQDMGRLMGAIQLPDSASLERTKRAMLEVEAITRQDPGVAHTIAICGMSFVQQANGPNFGSLFVILKPFAERQSPELKDEAIMARLQRVWAEKIKGARDAKVVVFGASPIPGLSVAGGFKTIVEDRGGLGVRNLQNQTDALIRRLQKEPGLTRVSTQFRSSIPQLFLDVDRTKVASLGVSLEDVNQTVGIYLGSLYVNSFNEFGRHWQVTLQAEGKFRSKIEDINQFQVRNRWGQMVPLGTLVNVREVTGPIFVNRYNLYQAAPITGSLLPGASTGDVIAQVDHVASDTLPRSMRADWTELMFMQILEGNTTPPQVVFALAVMCVFLALAGLYESWTLPLAVILVVPLCVLWSVVGVLLTNNSVNIFVQIGLVVLVGLACKNAILIVEFAREKHEEGQPVLQATQEAARLRLRPILMTSLAFILGVLPLVVASGAGAEMRRSLGTAVFSGMIGVTVFGVLLTPVFFYVIQGFGETRLFASAETRLVLSCVLGGSLGVIAGYLLARLGVVPMVPALVIGGCAGVLGVLAVLGAHRRLWSAGEPPK
jgi:multidrug efflux pump